MITRQLLKIWRSYGCQLGILYYFSDLTVLQLQLINRDSYDRTIARCQYTFRIPKMMIFTITNYTKFANCIIIMSEMSGEPQKFEDDRLDFYNTKTVLVKNQLYVFKFGRPVSVYKISDFTRNKHLVKTSLDTLP